MRLERWAPGAAITLTVSGGAEVLVLDGAFDEGGEHFEAQSWLRLPAGGVLQAKAGAAGCRVCAECGSKRDTFFTSRVPSGLDTLV